MRWWDVSSGGNDSGSDGDDVVGGSNNNDGDRGRTADDYEDYDDGGDINNRV